MNNILIFGGGGIAQGMRDVFADENVVVLSQMDVDVISRSRVRQAVAFQKWDAVIVTAGVDDEKRPAHVIDVNLTGSLSVALEATQRSIPTILIASVAGLYGKPEHTAYCASKAGVISIVQSLGFKHRIWAISPGRVDTPMREAHYPNDTPGSRLAPTDVALVAKDMLHGRYPNGSNVIIRKVGLEKIVLQVEVNPWRETLNVGKPVTI